MKRFGAILVRFLTHADSKGKTQLNVSSGLGSLAVSAGTGTCDGPSRREAHTVQSSKDLRKKRALVLPQLVWDCFFPDRKEKRTRSLGSALRVPGAPVQVGTKTDFDRGSLCQNASRFKQQNKNKCLKHTRTYNQLYIYIYTSKPWSVPFSDWFQGNSQGHQPVLGYPDCDTPMSHASVGAADGAPTPAARAPEGEGTESEKRLTLKTLCEP